MLPYFRRAAPRPDASESRTEVAVKFAVRQRHVVTDRAISSIGVQHDGSAVFRVPGLVGQRIGERELPADSAVGASISSSAVSRNVVFCLANTRVLFAPRLFLNPFARQDTSQMRPS